MPDSRQCACSFRKYSRELEGQRPSSAEEEAQADDERKALRASALQDTRPEQARAQAAFAPLRPSISQASTARPAAISSQAQAGRKGTTLTEAVR